MKVLCFLISLFIVTFSSTAWRDVGHGVVASIALKNLTPKTKTEVEALLSKQIANPGYIKCNSANSQYNMVAIASWADLAKRGKWDEGKEFSKFYNGCHIISCSKKITNNDVLMTENMAEDLINFAVVDSEGSNVLTGINSSIKTLELSQSPEQKAFALRLLVHYSGDAACPIHTADPIYYYYKGDEYEGFNTTGGNAFVFREPYYFKNIDGSSHEILNLHKFWDGMGGACNQIAPYEGKIELTAEQIKYYNEISDELIEKFKNKHDEINNNPDFKKIVIHSVVEGHNTALPPRLFETSKYEKIIHGHMNKY